MTRAPESTPEADSKKIPRVKLPPVWGEKGYVRWRVAQVIFGGRPEDKPIRRRILKGGSGVTVVGLLLTAITRIWLVVAEPMLKDRVADQPKRDAAMLVALQGIAKVAENTERIAGQAVAAAERSNTVAADTAQALHDIASALGVKAGRTQPVAEARVTARPVGPGGGR